MIILQILIRTNLGMTAGARFGQVTTCPYSKNQHTDHTASLSEAVKVGKYGSQFATGESIIREWRQLQTGLIAIHKLRWR
ncbi:hypothetical protein [Pontibacter actiniarum]|uniref:Uncharacterized protein n=1 Tax=Pontibacter actiniarum TaxID=323450 RepID=A0A1X9YV20_9BACT|nr:hypothetical protein [Pontibacter actiniarum]ARS36766.1 hypothetical protein CA264_15805 [Pontibacter actiniarum]